MSTHAQVLRLRRARRCLAINGSDGVAFSLSGQDRHTKVVPVFKQNTGSSMAGLRYPSHGRSRQTGRPIRPSAEGRSSWLDLLRKILAFSIPNRFYPGTPRHLFFFNGSAADIPLRVFEVHRRAIAIVQPPRRAGRQSRKAPSVFGRYNRDRS